MERGPRSKGIGERRKGLGRTDQRKRKTIETEGE